MEKKKEFNKAFFVREKCHQKFKEFAVKNKINLSTAIEQLLELGLNAYYEQKSNKK